MKPYLLILLTVFCFSSYLSAQDPCVKTNRFSALAMQYISESKEGTSAKLNEKYVFSEIENQAYLNAFIKVKSSSVESELEAMGILVGTKAGNIWTIKIPSSNLEMLRDKDLAYESLQLDQPIYTNLDKAREKTNVDKVHLGTALPQSFSGKEVVMGVIDVGFDYTHPTFYDTSGTKYRIKRIWEQKSSGTPPSNYNYGHEIIDPTEMVQRQSDNHNQSHGSHVAGIAAGSGFGGDGDKYRGVAFESDLVFVGITPPQEQWKNTGMTDIIDGINYIFEYAAAEGKPAIANLSWGCSIGPHDGTSLFSQALDNLTGEGRIFTVSAGNNGGNNIHLNKTFSNTDSLLQSFVNFSSSLDEDKTWIDIWGEPNESFCVEFRLYRTVDANAMTGFMCLEDLVRDTFLIGSDGDTLFIHLSGLNADINGKPHAFLDIHAKTNDNVALAVKSKSGEVNVWMGYVLESTGYYGSFQAKGQAWAINGDDAMTIGEMACSKSAITVGAYASKNSFRNLSGQNLSYSNYVGTNKICPFSSRGPCSDARTKPDITAPGMTIASAFNSFDGRYAPGGSNYNLCVYKYTDPNNTRDYYFGESSGTSMSAPMTAGIIGLLLEAKPDLTPEEIKSLMSSTAITDSYTTATPNANIWGPGKIDAYAIFQSFFPSSVEDNVLEDLTMYPNPTSDELNISFSGEKLVTVFNMIGENCLRLRTSKSIVSLAGLETGSYIVNVYNKNNDLVLIQKIFKL